MKDYILRKEKTMEETRDIKERVFEDLQYAKVGTEEYERMVDCLVKVKRLELDGLKNEADAEMKEHQRKRDIIDLVLKHGLTAFGIVTTTFVTIFLFGQGMQFEKEDTFRSTTMRNFMSKNFFKLKNW